MSLYVQNLQHIEAARGKQRSDQVQNIVAQKNTKKKAQREDQPYKKKMNSGHGHHHEHDESEEEEESVASAAHGHGKSKMSSDCRNVESNEFVERNQKYDKMNDLQKYKEIQRRTKLLYGVKDIKRMIEKSDQSKFFFQHDLAYKTTDKHN